MNKLVLIGLCWMLWGRGIAAAATPTTDVETSGQELRLLTAVEAPFSGATVWRLIEDYERLADYMPNVDSSRVVARTDSSVLVRQVATSRLLLPWTFHLTLEFVRESAERLRFRMLEGNMRSYAGCWKVEPVPGGARISYSAIASRRLPLPNFLLAYVVRRQMRRMLPALLEELSRRTPAETEKKP